MVTMNGLSRVRDRLRRAKGGGYSWERMERDAIRREVAAMYKGGTLPLDLGDLLAKRLEPLWMSRDRWYAALDAFGAEVAEATKGDPLSVGLAALAAERLEPWGHEHDRRRELDDVKADLCAMYARAHPRPGHGNMPARAIEVKSAATGDTATVYACVFGNIDLQDDIVVPGAVNNIDDFVKTGWLDINHEGKEPIGDIVSAVQDSKGLLTTVRFFDTPRGQAVKTIVRSRLAAKKDAQASIGYRVNDAHFDRVNGRPVRFLTSIDVKEVSFVNMAANPSAGFLPA